MPGQFESILDKLQRKLGKQTIRKASSIARPKPRPDVIQMNLFNEFAKRNPKADGGSVDDYEPSAFSKKVNELMDDGYDFGEAVREAMRQGYAYGGKIKQGPQKGKHRFFVGRSPNIKNFYADTIEEGKAWEKKTRLRQRTDKPFGKALRKSELNKASQYFFQKDYDELTDPKQKRKAYDRVRDAGRRKDGKAKFKVKTADKPLTSSQQAKIKKEFPNAKFGPRRKLGFAPTDPEYQEVFRFRERGFKSAYQGGMFKSLPKYAQEELINAFPDVEFNFERQKPKVIKRGGKNVITTKGTSFSKYGVPITHPRYNSIARYFDDPKPFRFGFDLRTAGGWTLAQMDRAAMQGDTRYEPIKQKPNKPISRTNKIIGIIDKTGKKPKTYNINNILKTHPNRAEIIKYVDVANKSRTPISNYPTISKILPEGFDPAKIQLNDLLQYLSKDKGGINRAKRAIELHHAEGVRNRATGNFQLLRQDKNKLADTIEQQIRKGNLDRSAELDAQRIRVETGGQKFGGKKLSPQTDFRNIVSGVEQDLSNFTKRDFSKLKKALGTVLKTTGKVIKPVGVVTGLAAVNTAVQAGERNPFDLAGAYITGDAEVATTGRRIRQDPEFRTQYMADILSKPLDEGTYDVMDESFTSYFDGGIVSLLKGVK